MKKQIAFMAAILMAAALTAQVTFVRSPSMVSAGAGQWTITFEVSRATDVEVSIVDTRDSTVVRHLAAGLLGPKAPPPFAVDLLSQTLVWDGTDDFGNTAAHPESLNVRVRAGMTPVLAAFVGENLYDTSGKMAVDPHGCRYVLFNTGARFHSPCIRKYDSTGNYIRTIFPPRADLPADSVVSYRVNVLPGGGWVPKTYPYVEHGVVFTSLVMRSATISYLAGRLMINSTVSGMHTLDTNGCFTDTAPNAMVLLRAAVQETDPGFGAKMLKAAAAADGYRDGPYVFERLTVDRTSDCVFWNGGYSHGAYMISDWNQPVTRDIQLRLDNIAVSPDGRFLYGWNGADWSAEACLKRFSRTSFTAVPFGSTGSNFVTGAFLYQYGAAGTPGNHRGIAVGWKGKVAAFSEASYLVEVADTAGSVTCGQWDAVPVGDCRKLVSATAPMEQARQNMMGVKYDPAGNCYVGLKKISKPIVPAGFGSDPAFRHIGAVVKFRPESTAVYNSATLALTGYDKIYPQPFGPFSPPANRADPIVGGSADCTCRNSYFDVDPYGRIYVPNGITCQVYVADNEGNSISVFGEYGNTDSRGRLSGPGELVPGNGIPMAWPTSVAASEDFIYVGDLINARLVRVRMAYDADNLPGLTLHGPDVAVNRAAVSKPHLMLSAAPNPFNPSTVISYDLGGAASGRMFIFNVQGSLVRAFALQGQSGRVEWDGRDATGRAIASGMYVLRLTAPGLKIERKITCMK